MSRRHLDHLEYLESEAIHVMREVAGEFERPAILFSGGNRQPGSFALIEPGTNATIAAGMLLPPREAVPGFPRPGGAG